MKKGSILLVVLVLVVVAGGLIAHFSLGIPAQSINERPIGVNVSVLGNTAPAGMKAVVVPDHSPFTMASLGPSVNITPAGTINGSPITLRFKLSKRVTSQEVLFAVRETANSGWTLMKPVVSTDGWYATVTTDHLSTWQPLLYDLGEAFNVLKDYFNGFSGDMFTSADKPTCLNETQARGEGYTITSSAKNTLYWCFGYEKGQRVLKLVNRTSYPLEVQHLNLTTIHQDYTLDADKLARFGSGHESFLFPFEEVDYTLDLKPGEKALVTTAYSGYAQALYRIEVGISSLILILSHFGLSEDNLSILASNKGMKVVLSTFNHFLDFKNCANALFPVPNGGKLISGCFTPAQVAEAFGWKGVILAPLMAVGSIFQYFRSELESLIDLARDADKYAVLIARADESAVLATYVGSWYGAEYQLTIYSDSTGQDVWEVPPASTGCYGHNSIAFKVMPDGSLLGTIRSLWYTPANCPPGEPQPDPGETFTLIHQGDHLLYQTWNRDGSGQILAPT
jgi:hypothetical protein